MQDNDDVLSAGFGAIEFGWALAAQSISSFANFGLAVFVAHTTSQKQFGIFATVFAAYVLCLGAARSLATEPYAVRYSSSGPRGRMEALSHAAGATLSVSSALALIGLVVGTLMPPDYGLSAVAIALTIPGLLLQDVFRQSFFALGRAFHAFANDLAWAVLQVIMIGIFLLSGAAKAWHYLMAWGLAAYGAAILGSWQSGTLPKPSATWDWVASNRHLSPGFLGEFLAITASSHLMFIVVAIAAGPEELASLRGAFLLMGPVSMLYMGATQVAVPTGVRILRRRSAMLRPAVIGYSSGLAAIALSWGMLLWVMPRPVRAFLAGESLAGAEELLLPVVVLVATSGIIGGPAVGLRIHHLATTAFRLRATLGVLTVATTAAGAYVAGARGAAVSAAVLGLVGSLAWWRTFLKTNRKEQPTVRDDTHRTGSPVLE